jgi:hypothetical protein
MFCGVSKFSYFQEIAAHLFINPRPIFLQHRHPLKTKSVSTYNFTSLSVLPEDMSVYTPSQLHSLHRCQNATVLKDIQRHCEEKQNKS